LRILVLLSATLLSALTGLLIRLLLAGLVLTTALTALLSGLLIVLAALLAALVLILTLTHYVPHVVVVLWMRTTIAASVRSSVGAYVFSLTNFVGVRRAGAFIGRQAAIKPIWMLRNDSKPRSQTEAL
jgi:hypothetical protein